MRATGRGDLLWPMAQQYRHVVAMNTPALICNHNLFDVFAPDTVSKTALAAVLNSTVVALSKHQFGRLAGREGNLKTEVVDVKMMLVPDPRVATEQLRERLESALESLRKREVGHLVDVDSAEEGPSGELAMSDRQELDDAVLELIGITDPAERGALRAELYAEMTKLYRGIRTAEKRMQTFRSETARRGRPSAHSLAKEIWENMEEKPQYKTLLDFSPLDDAEEVELPEGKAKPVNDLWNRNSLMIGAHYIPLGHPSRVAFAKILSDIGVHGPVRIPNDPEVSQRTIIAYEKHVAQVTDEFTTLAATYTSDEQMQERIVRELWRIVRSQHSS